MLPERPNEKTARLGGFLQTARGRHGVNLNSEFGNPVLVYFYICTLRRKMSNADDLDIRIVSKEDGCHGCI